MPSSRGSRRPPHFLKIGLLVYPGCLPAGLFAASDMLLAINRRMGVQVFEPVWIGVGNDRVSLVQGPVLELSNTLPERCDAYLLPGFWAESAADLDQMLERQKFLVDWLRQVPAETALWSYCMGVALVAEAGRIDRRAATATWWLEKPLRSRFTAVEWDFQRSVIADENSITAAGANGYWALLRKILLDRIPPVVIRDVEQAMLVPHVNNGHPAFRPVELMLQLEPRLQRLIAHVQRVPATDISVGSAAAYLAVSPRTLSRKIEQHTQVSAGQWLRLIKLRQVADALLSSAASIKTICAEVGFADEASLMRSFKRTTGMTTSQYRQQYGHSIELSFTDEQ